MNETQHKPENGRETPVAKNVTQFGNGQLIGILSVFVAVAGMLVAVTVFGFNNVNRRIDDLAASMNARFDDMAALMNARFEDVNRRIDDNTAELRLIRGDVNGLTERMTKVETIIDFRPQVEVDGENNPIAASTPRDQR